MRGNHWMLAIVFNARQPVSQLASQPSTPEQIELGDFPLILINWDAIEFICIVYLMRVSFKIEINEKIHKFINSQVKLAQKKWEKNALEKYQPSQVAISFFIFKMKKHSNVFFSSSFAMNKVFSQLNEEAINDEVLNFIENSR